MKVTVCDFWGYGIEDLVASCFAPSWISCSAGSQPPCHEDTRDAFWRVPGGEELKPLASLSAQEPAPTGLLCEEANPPAPSSLQMTAALASIWVQPHKSPWAKTTHQAACSFLQNPPKSQIIHIYYCFKPLSFLFFCGFDKPVSFEIIVTQQEVTNAARSMRRSGVCKKRWHERPSPETPSLERLLNKSV